MVSDFKIIEIELRYYSIAMNDLDMTGFTYATGFRI